MSLRIIGGKWKGRILHSVPTSKTRPTQSIVREALFNICQHAIQEATFLDCFAGSGAIGLEALSRGAKSVTFIESKKEALTTIHKNCELLGVKEKAMIFSIKAEIALQKLKTSFDIIYLDPPYDLSLTPFIHLILKNGLLKKGGFLFLEERATSKKEIVEPDFLKNFDASDCLKIEWISSRKFGEALLHQYQATN